MEVETGVGANQLTPSDDEALARVQSEIAQVGAEHALATLRLLMSSAKDEKVRVKAAEIILEAAGLKGKAPSTIGFNFNVPREHFSRVLSGLGKLGKAKIRDISPETQG